LDTGFAQKALAKVAGVDKRVARGPSLTMPEPVTIIGSYLSPYVRKVLFCLDFKGIGYRIDPIVPFLGDDRFSRLSPVRRVPVLIDDRVFVFGDVSIADISVATFFRNASFAGFGVDGQRWPITAAFVERVLAIESFAALRVFEKLLLRTPVAQHREALAAIGAPLTSESYGTTSPRRGVMQI
jgi:glutathione S-transferase